jgi:hypothetical protein
VAAMNPVRVVRGVVGIRIAALAQESIHRVAKDQPPEKVISELLRRIENGRRPVESAVESGRPLPLVAYC